MKFSYNWIKEFVDGLDVEAESLERLITMKTAECEGVEKAGELLANAVPARVLSVERIEGSHNVKAVVDAGKYGTKTVACGAPNCRDGLLTAYVPLGVKKVSGILSDGMLASGAELGINKDHDGVVDLTSDSLPARDSVIEIDNKSITHRPDLWGHYGMAREVAAITGKQLVDRVPIHLLPQPAGPVKIVIEDFALCPRYSALVFENVTVQPSPLWLQFRLTSIGMNPINNIVDITNFIMAELAQPMHAFDRDKLHGETIYARRATEAESFIALNGETYELNPNNLVIADASGPIALAGVIGGRDSAISANTGTIVLESANFNASNIRKTSSTVKLRTDASMRFEKAQDPLNTVRALARAMELLPLVSPGIRLVGGLADLADSAKQTQFIELRLDWLGRKLGRVLKNKEVRRILESLQFPVFETDANTFQVEVPSWRATKDVAMPEDLVEEVGRMIGYSTIDPAPPLVPCAPSFDPPEREYFRNLRRIFASQGFDEVYNYSFLSEKEAARFGFAAADHIRVLNPIAAGQELMRTSLLPGIYRNILDNAKHFDRFRIFEIGREIHPVDETKPIETPHLMAAIYSTDDGKSALFELKRAAECIAPNLQIEPNSGPAAWQHPTRSAHILRHGRIVGTLCELHPTLVEAGRAAIVDLDLTLLQELAPARGKYKSIRRFPTSAFDLSILVDSRTLAGTLESAIRTLAGEAAETVRYVTEYQGAPLPVGKKSVSFRIVVGAPDKTLSSDEINAIRLRIVEGLNASGFGLRI